MVVTLEYPSAKGGLLAVVQAEVRLTAKRIFVEKAVGHILYLRRPGTKKALAFVTPKVFYRDNGLPVGKKTGFRTWMLQAGTVQKLNGVTS